MEDAGGAVHRSVRRIWPGWLALFALLLQIAVPDLAMAARAGRVSPASPLESVDHAGLTLLVDAAGDEAASWCGFHAAISDEQPQVPAASHDDGRCPFCLALAAHALPPGRTGDGIVFARAGPVAAWGFRQHLPASLFLTSQSPRAPPAA